MSDFPKPLTEIITEAISSFAQINGLPFDAGSMKVTAAKDRPTDLAGHIGFTSDQMKGSLTLLCDMKFLEKTYPASSDGQKAEDTELKDWLGEMANLLLGRTKNILLEYGINLSLGTPTIITGKEINFDSSSLNNYFNFTLAQNPISLYANVKVGKNVEFTKKEETNQGAKESDVLLF
jgi:CheY-specific phosphatase CheX